MLDLLLEVFEDEALESFEEKLDDFDELARLDTDDETLDNFDEVLTVALDVIEEELDNFDEPARLDADEKILDTFDEVLTVALDVIEEELDNFDEPAWTLDFIDEIALESAKEETPTDEFEELETVELIRLVEAVELEESPMGDGISPILAVMEDLVIETLTLLVFEPEEEPPPQPAKIKAKNKILNQFIIYASHSILLIFLIFGDTTGIS